MIVGIQGKKKQQQLGKSGTGGQLHSMTTMSLVGNITFKDSNKKNHVLNDQNQLYSQYWVWQCTECL